MEENNKNTSHHSNTYSATPSAKERHRVLLTERIHDANTRDTKDDADYGNENEIDFDVTDSYESVKATATHEDDSDSQRVDEETREGSDAAIEGTDLEPDGAPVAEEIHVIPHGNFIDEGADQNSSAIASPEGEDTTSSEEHDRGWPNEFEMREEPENGWQDERAGQAPDGSYGPVDGYRFDAHLASSDVYEPMYDAHEVIHRNGNSQRVDEPVDIADLSTHKMGYVADHPIQRYSGVGAQGIRRARLNRMLMRKRRLERSGRMVRRLLVVGLIIAAVIGVVLSSSAGAAYAYYESQLPLLNGVAQHSLFQTTRIYDRNGHLLYELYDHQLDKGRRTYVNYSDISPNLVNATVAAEDHTFWTNSGVDYYGIVRATVANLQHHAIVQGASTVTEQFVDVQFFNAQKRDIQVKGEEAILATGLTQQYPKWKIMEMYLNTVYYGDLNYGVEAAAESYFNLQQQCTRTNCVPTVKHLDIAQAALLAGLPQSPSAYAPTTNKAAALQRQRQVLDSMYQLGMITQEQEQQAIQETQKMVFKPYSATHHIQAPHFVSYVVDQVLVPLLGAQNILDGGYNVYTTLDLNLEKKVEQIVNSHLYQPQEDNYLGYYGPLNQTNNVNNAAAVVQDPKTGEILAMDGSANYNNNSPMVQGEYNSAVSLRQPGSSFKPIVYATAFEMGWYPAMIIPDHKTYYPGNVTPPYYSPQNYDGTFHTGFPMTARTAIANSYNIPAIDALEFAGIPNVLNMAGRLGLTEVASRPLNSLGPSIALGTTEVSLLHLTGAYATFANQGVRTPQTSILEITDNQGRPVYQFNPNHPGGERVLGADVSFLISSILSDKPARYHEFGPGNPLEQDFPAAAKTGTTDSFRDNWTMGYTPHLAVGVWAGNSDNSIMQNVIGITGAGPIWHDILDYATHYYHFAPDGFVPPSNVHQQQVSAITGLLPRPGEPTTTDWFIDGTLPTIQGDYYYAPPAPGPCTQFCRPAPVPPPCTKHCTGH